MLHNTAVLFNGEYSGQIYMKQATKLYFVLNIIRFIIKILSSSDK